MLRRIFGPLALLLTLSCPLAAHAQDWPSRQPIKVIVPFTAGSSTDIAARTVFDQVSRQLGQTFVVENKGGAGTSLGSYLAAKSDPDGYTILVNSTSHVVVASTYAKLPYSVADDFAPIGAIADIPFLVGTNTKFKSLKELIETAKKPGGSILYGTAGAGSSGHLFMELLRLTAGYPTTHVPFRGTPEAMTEMIAGRLDMYPTPAANAVPLTRQGQINSLAVSSPKRLPSLPEVATLRELGLADAEYQFWVGAFAPAKTPRPIVEQLNRHIALALNMKDVADKLLALGGSPMPMATAEFEGFVQKQIELNAKIVKAAGYQPQ
ncbi:Bug family tripartite tricarboxylate transporter substrate binding protein [Rhodoplanes sp. Z2-YC6860]|uniref:Bug family tripartite tricarboxylate transporter substrate binding protein n=1 Tax=Rhodoplanes sp. Z2-YC6860 TaxID=674703 RepID=UPI00078D36CD|nr:tripartite tricarboxylate transporter substrate-binding protein [Rhodoplanes sp. Z2-YC6860]AMN40411.1 extracytoplasmic binding receptor [Rhodoplanes sp. Z2-YC6860]